MKRKELETSSPNDIRDVSDDTSRYMILSRDYQQEFGLTKRYPFTDLFTDWVFADTSICP